ncbi:hypothetical protein ACFL3S_07585, partial [Gemmatimonadota bacterium]
LRDPGARDPGVVEVAQHSLGLIRETADTIRVVDLYPGPVYQYSEFQGRLTRTVLPFSGSTRFGVSADRVHVGFPDRSEIRVFGSNGALERIVRRVFHPIRVTDADMEWLLERRLGEVDGAENQSLVRQAFRGLRHAEEMPAFGVPVWTSGREKGGPDMIADAEGNLWVFDYYRPGEYRNRFSVFSPEGVWMGSVDVPEGLQPSQIGADFLIGTLTDEMGFVHVRQHRLVKPPYPGKEGGRP